MQQCEKFNYAYHILRCMEWSVPMKITELDRNAMGVDQFVKLSDPMRNAIVKHSRNYNIDPLKAIYAVRSQSVVLNMSVYDMTNEFVAIKFSTKPCIGIYHRDRNSAMCYDRVDKTVSDKLKTLFDDIQAQKVKLDPASARSGIVSYKLLYRGVPIILRISHAVNPMYSLMVNDASIHCYINNIDPELSLSLYRSNIIDVDPNSVISKSSVVLSKTESDILKTRKLSKIKYMFMILHDIDSLIPLPEYIKSVTDRKALRQDLKIYLDRFHRTGILHNGLSDLSNILVDTQTNRIYTVSYHNSELLDDTLDTNLLKLENETIKCLELFDKQ